MWEVESNSVGNSPRWGPAGDGGKGHVGSPPTHPPTDRPTDLPVSDPPSQVRSLPTMLCCRNQCGKLKAIALRDSQQPSSLVPRPRCRHRLRTGARRALLTQWRPEVTKRYRSRNANTLVATTTVWTIHPDARLEAMGTCLRFIGAPLGVTNLTAGGSRHCAVAPCGWPEVTG